LLPEPKLSVVLIVYDTNPKRQRGVRRPSLALRVSVGVSVAPMGGSQMRGSRVNEPPMADALAYFLTWPTYGTWLPGDARGWVEYRQGWKMPNPVRELEAKARMSEDACFLDGEQRKVVEQTIADHCRIRGWELHAVNCRTNHLHIVVTADRDPDQVRVQFKAWCTRRLKELEAKRRSQIAGRENTGCIREQWWAERGSRRFINDGKSLEAAIRYVEDGQD
jgi:REP element-mobilizing transposase RayT